MDRPAFFAALDRRFAGTLAAHGASAGGVDWKSEESQRARFDQLMRIHDGSQPFSLLDYGCGYGALADHLDPDGSWTYTGYDVSPRMVALARDRNPDPRRRTFTDREEDLEPADYAVASGVFNLRLHVDDATWRRYVLEGIGALHRLSRRGFAFNMLSTYSDPPRRRDDLYYGDPAFFFDHCKRHCSPNVALMHDYGLYELTILVRT